VCRFARMYATTPCPAALRSRGRMDVGGNNDITPFPSSMSMELTLRVLSAIDALDVKGGAKTRNEIIELRESFKSLISETYAEHQRRRSIDVGIIPAVLLAKLDVNLQFTYMECYAKKQLHAADYEAYKHELETTRGARMSSMRKLAMHHQRPGGDVEIERDFADLGAAVVDFLKRVRVAKMHYISPKRQSEDIAAQKPKKIRTTKSHAKKAADIDDSIAQGSSVDIEAI